MTRALYALLKYIVVVMLFAIGASVAQLAIWGEYSAFKYLLQGVVAGICLLTTGYCIKKLLFAPVDYDSLNVGKKFFYNTVVYVVPLIACSFFMGMVKGLIESGKI